MADVTRWNQFWFEIFHPRKAQEARMNEYREQAKEAINMRKNYRPPLPEGFTVKYAMLYGFPHIILYHGGKKITDQMVHGGDTNKAYRAILSTARFIHENNVET